ncbi:hypothetical protein NVP1187O_216 [Vibrio phage 1.187.O._10N.286.49.F1]|nr:hypothetical protein NVP1187O_216 [Vibrio phage 1.187.O._10N.286.49.F1]
MITAKDLHKHLKSKKSEKNVIIDSWLQDKVFNNFTHNEQGFVCPDGVLPSEAKELLELRGFKVDTYNNNTGGYIYITLPPQGE